MQKKETLNNANSFSDKYVKNLQGLTSHMLSMPGLCSMHTSIRNYFKCSVQCLNFQDLNELIICDLISISRYI